MPEPLNSINSKPADGSDSVVFKGYKSGLTLIIPENGSFHDYLEDLQLQLAQSHNFFKGAKIAIRTGNRELSEAEQSQLFELIQKSGLILQRFNEDTKTSKRQNKQVNFPEEELIPTTTVKKTLRSGQRVEFDGNVLIMGDVNPGAEVIASGDIIVLGKLRGTAHAGVKGDGTAQIVAFQIKPVQIRIAGVYTRSPEKEQKAVKHIGPEVAKIKENRIVVEIIKLDANHKY